MARPLILPPYFRTTDFTSLYKRYGQQKFGLRLLALCYLQEGHGVKEVSRRLSKTQTTIRYWVTLYGEGGLERLLSIGSGRGRPGKLSVSEEADFQAEISTLTAALKGGRLRAYEIGQLLEEKFGVFYSRSGIYALLHRLGYSWITSRSVHPKADPEAQEVFKK